MAFAWAGATFSRSLKCRIHIGIASISVQVFPSPCRVKAIPNRPSAHIPRASIVISFHAPHKIPDLLVVIGEKEHGADLARQAVHHPEGMTRGVPLLPRDYNYGDSVEFLPRPDSACFMGPQNFEQKVRPTRSAFAHTRAPASILRCLENRKSCLLLRWSGDI